jgi:hypothetical protein
MNPGYAAPQGVYAPPGAGGPYWLMAPPVTQRRNNGMRVTGIALFIAGGAISALGGVDFGALATTPCEFINFGDEPGGSPRAVHERVGAARQALNGCETSPTVGIAIIAAGLVTAVAGVPLFVIGSQQVPVQRTSQSLLPAVTVGDRSASLRWTF